MSYRARAPLALGSRPPTRPNSDNLRVPWGNRRTMSYNRSADDADSWWTIIGVALLLVGLISGAIFYQGGGTDIGAFLILLGVLGGPIVIGLFSQN